MGTFSGVRRFAAAFALVVALSGVATSAHAASPLVASDPAPREVVSQQPGWLTLAFSRTVDQDVVKVLVLNERGENVAVGAIEYYGSSILLQLNNNLKPGTFTVMWKIDQPNGEPEGGAFQFAWGTPRWTDVSNASWAGTEEEPPVMANPDPQATVPLETAEATPSVTPTPTDTPSPQPSTGPSASGQASVSPTGAPSAPPPSSAVPWAWLAVGGVVALAAVVAVAVAMLRGRRGRPPADG